MAPSKASVIPATRKKKRAKVNPHGFSQKTHKRKNIVRISRATVNWFGKFIAPFSPLFSNTPLLSFEGLLPILGF